MPKFQYQACDATGRPLQGETEALDAEAARAQLEQAGLQNVRVMVMAHVLARPLSEPDVAELSRNLAELTARALPLAPGLRALAAELPAGTLRTVLNEVAVAIDQGQTLAEALESQGGRLPAHLRGLVLAGSRTGRLDRILEEFVQQHQIGVELRQRAAMAMFYPLALLVFAIAAFSFTCFFMIHEFDDLYRSFNMKMPEVTLLLVAIAKGYPWLVGGGCLAALFSWFACRKLLSPPLRRRLVLRLPLLGTMWRWLAWAEFSQLLALLLESELPLPSALKLAGGAVRDADIADACRLIANDVETGQSLADSAACRTRLPAILYPMLAWAESQRNLPETLRTAGQMFEGQARIQARVVIFVAPLLGFLAVLVTITVSVLALVLPIFRFLDMLT